MNMRLNNRVRWNRLVFLIIGSLILSAIHHALATATAIGKFPPRGQMISVGDHRLHIHCMGYGDPTVVLESGMSGWSVDWALVQRSIATQTRVCAYDRAGYGWSDEGPRPRDSQQIVTELHMLLQNTGILGKYILVGHSLGGLFVQLYARTYPEEIAGIVLIDSVHPDQSLRMNAAVRRNYEGNLKALTMLTSLAAPTGLMRLVNQPETPIVAKLPSENQAVARALGLHSKAYRALAEEMAAFDMSQREVRGAGTLPHVPISVISSVHVRDFPPGFSQDSIKTTWDELQSELVSAHVGVTHVIAKNSGHYIHLDQPNLVNTVVFEMVAKARETTLSLRRDDAFCAV